MFLVYSVIFCVLAKSIDGYSPKRQARVTSADNIYIDNFPEVEYPASVTDTIKPFYLNSNPFSSDVQSSFKSLSSGATTKSRPTIILNINTSDNSKDKNKHKVVLAEKNIKNKEKQSSDIECNDKKTNNQSSIVISEKDSGSQNDEVEVTGPVEEESSIDSELEYLVGFIDNVDDVITTVSGVGTEIIAITDASMQIFDDEHSNEIATITSDVPLVNNYVSESNERSSNTETSVLNEIINNSTTANWLVNEDSSEYNNTDLLFESAFNDTDVYNKLLL